MNQKKVILIVEDDKGLRDLLVHGISPKYEVLQAGDGEEAVSTIESQRPSLVLLDILLPKMDGYKVLEVVRKNPDRELADTRIIILSNLWTDKDILRAQSLKIDEYLVKSNSPLPVIIERIDAILNK